MVKGRRLPGPGLIEVPLVEYGTPIRVADIKSRRFDLIDRGPRCSADGHPGKGGRVDECPHPECVVRAVLES